MGSAVFCVHFSVKSYCGFLPFLVKALFYLLHNIEDLFWSFQMEDQDHNGYLLFKKEQANKLKKEGIKVTSLEEHNEEMSKAWNALNEEQQKSYAKSAKVARPEKGKINKKAPFETHFSLSQFISLMCYIGVLDVFHSSLLYLRMILNWLITSYLCKANTYIRNTYI